MTTMLLMPPVTDVLPAQIVHMHGIHVLATEPNEAKAPTNENQQLKQKQWQVFSKNALSWMQRR